MKLIAVKNVASPAAISFESRLLNLILLGRNFNFKHNCKLSFIVGEVAEFKFAC